MRNELASFTSFGEALKTVRAPTSPRAWAALRRSTRWCCRKPLAVIGVAMNDPETGEGWWAGKIGPDHVAALPYEIYLIDGKAYARSTAATASRCRGRRWAWAVHAHRTRAPT